MSVPRSSIRAYQFRHLVIAGSGLSLPNMLRQLNHSNFKGKVTICSSGFPWPYRIRDKYLRAGQSRTAILNVPAEHLYAPRERIPVGDVARFHNQELGEAVWNMPPGIELAVVESDISRVTKNGKGVGIDCFDGAQIEADHVLLNTGLGPEKDAQAAGIMVPNSAVGSRILADEMTTGLVSLGKPVDWYKGKRIAIYGGGALAAWVAEQAIMSGVRSIVWSARNFDGANPGGRNSDTLKLTEDHRMEAEIKTATYLGDLETGSGVGIDLQHLADSKKASYPVDKLVVAVGSDPFGAGGIRSVLGGIYDELKPRTSPDGGVFASTENNRVMVTTAPLYNNRRIAPLIRAYSFPKLESENQVAGGLAVQRMSATGALDSLIKAEPEQPDAEGD